MSPAPGPHNLITDVPGLLVGNANSDDGTTGVTVLLPKHGEMGAAVDQRGGAPGTRDTDALRPENAVQHIHGLCLAGGSAYGLSAVDGVQAFLRSRDQGLSIMGALVPVVPGAIIFDLYGGLENRWERFPPHREIAFAACNAADTEFSLGCVGAGAGSIAGAIKGGLGSASYLDEVTGFTVGALAVVNSAGSVVMDDETGAFWAWPYEHGNEFGGRRSTTPVDPEPFYPKGTIAGANTTIAVIATDAPLGRVTLSRIAVMAQDGVARAIRPVHAPYDGDTVFALSTAHPDKKPLATGSPEALRLAARLGALAADCLARAIARGVHEAEGAQDVPSWKDLYPL